MLNDPRKTAQLAIQVLEIACRDPLRGYAFAITKTLRARHGNSYTHALDIGDLLRKLVKEELLEELGFVKGDKGHPRLMYGPTWKAYLYLNLQGTNC